MPTTDSSMRSRRGLLAMVPASWVENEIARGADGLGEPRRSAVIMRYGGDTSWSQRAAEVSGFRQILEEAARRRQGEQDAASQIEGDCLRSHIAVGVYA